MKNDKIEKAKQVLKDAGYSMDRLWHIDEVKARLKCSDEEAREILLYVLKNEWLDENIKSQIDYQFKMMNKEKANQ